MQDIKKSALKSIRMKLFITLSIAIITIIIFLIILNNFVLETFYLYSKQKDLIEVYENINKYYANEDSNIDLELELEKAATNNNFDIIIKTDKGINVYTSSKDFSSTIGTITEIESTVSSWFSPKTILYKNERIIVRKTQDSRSGLGYILLSGNLDNGYVLYIRIPVSSIRESVKISNNFFYLIGGIAVIIGGIVVLVISKKFTKPIVELNEIAKKMTKLDFSKKYRITDTDDEINELGENMNTVSDKLEATIKQLKEINIELEKDIEQKSKIDEMRKQFISDVSHELKTPIAIIQGYAEGLKENVNTDPESRDYYAEVILDEANKMDKLVKQLLELMKLEYGKREFNNQKFNIVELAQEVIRKSNVMYEEQNIKVEVDAKNPIFVFADDFYIEQVVTNYFTNAIKHAKEVNGEKKIKFTIKENVETGKVRISVHNTGDRIDEEDLSRIWNRFYKVDSSRNRTDGGSGIGLSLVKAIMMNYNNEYGAFNTDTGVEFYFELDAIE